MKRSLLLILLAAAAAAQAQAQSSVTISGTVDVFAGSRQLSGGARSTRVDSGGMKADFALGMFLRADSGDSGRFAGDAFFGRSSYVGLSSSWGSVRLGRQTTGNFVNFLRTNSYGDSATFGPAFVHTWISAIGQGTKFVTPGAPPTSRSLTGPLGTIDTAWNNAVGYLSPTVGGFNLTAQWAPGEANGVGSRRGAAAFYAAGPLNIGLAAQDMGAGAVPASGPAAAALREQATWHLSGAYAFSFARISSGYLHTRRDFATVVDDKLRTRHLGASIPAGPGAMLLQTAVSRQAPATGASVKRSTTSIGYDYLLSKRTDVYAVYMRDKLTGNASGDTYAAGLRHRF